MTISVVMTNFALGAVYLAIGVITIIDLKRGWRTMGLSHVGLAFLAMAFTCGPHHLVHAFHVAFEERYAGPVDLGVVLVGLPAGLIWFTLRVEATAGGRGDRLIRGTPRWMAALPWLWVAYLAAFVTTAVAILRQAGDFGPKITPNLLLVGLYNLIGYYLLRTQLANRRPLGGWSVSGLALTFVFPTCALMHAVYATYATAGRFDVEAHGLVIDWLSVPAALYFVWVVRSLSRGAFTDWNRSSTGIQARAQEQPQLERV